MVAPPKPPPVSRAPRQPGCARARFALFPQLVIFAAGKPVLDARIAYDHRFAQQGRVVHALKAAINVHHLIRPAEQTGELVEQSAVDADELDLGGLTESGQMD